MAAENGLEFGSTVAGDVGSTVVEGPGLMGRRPVIDQCDAQHRSEDLAWDGGCSLIDQPRLSRGVGQPAGEQMLKSGEV